MENLTISTLPVTIRVMEVGGKRLTLSVFKQIPEGYYFFDNEFTDEQRREQYLGWVIYSDRRYILYHRFGILLKDDFEEMRVTKNIRELAEAEKRVVSWLGHSDSPHLEALRAEAEKRRNELRLAREKADKHNDMWGSFLQNKDQVYIAI